eukprot:Clim_evm26s235 gene=Clim_evmTU26s235
MSPRGEDGTGRRQMTIFKLPDPRDDFRALARSFASQKGRRDGEGGGTESVTDDDATPTAELSAEELDLKTNSAAETLLAQQTYYQTPRYYVATRHAAELVDMPARGRRRLAQSTELKDSGMKRDVVPLDRSKSTRDSRGSGGVDGSHTMNVLPIEMSHIQQTTIGIAKTLGSQQSVKLLVELSRPEQAFSTSVNTINVEELHFFDVQEYEERRYLAVIVHRVQDSSLNHGENDSETIEYQRSSKVVREETALMVVEVKDRHRVSNAVNEREFNNSTPTNDDDDNHNRGTLTTKEEPLEFTVMRMVPVLSDMRVDIVGHGGFLVRSGNFRLLFRMPSVRAMWQTLQVLNKAKLNSEATNQYSAQTTHGWIKSYESLVPDLQSVTVEEEDAQNLAEDDVLDMDTDEATDTSSTTNASEVTSSSGTPQQLIRKMSLSKIQIQEKNLSESSGLSVRDVMTGLRIVMKDMDLDEVSCRMVREALEDHFEMDLVPWRQFIEQKMVVVMGQLLPPSQIFDYLWLGTEWNATHLEELQELDIDFVLNMATELDNFFPEHFTYFKVDIWDEPEADLYSHLENVCDFLEGIKAQNKRVLVHCQRGISRSGSAVIAFAMKHYGWTYDRALAEVRGQRNVVDPNPGFEHQLRQWESQLVERGILRNE